MTKFNGVQMKTYNDLMKFMRTKQFAIEVLSMVESVVGYNFMSLRILEPNIKTLADYARYVEESKGQQTVYLTVRAAYEFEYAIKRVLSDHGFETVSKIHNTAEQKNDFGVQVSDREQTAWFEVKTTQSKNGWTGATHSKGSGKVDNYVLVSYELDRDMTLPPIDGSSPGALHGVFKSVHFSVVDAFDMGWHGAATDRSSFTTAKIHNSQHSAYTPQIVLGSTDRKTVNCAINRESLNPYRVNGVLKSVTGGTNVNIAAR